MNDEKKVIFTEKIVKTVPVSGTEEWGTFSELTTLKLGSEPGIVAWRSLSWCPGLLWEVQQHLWSPATGCHLHFSSCNNPSCVLTWLEVPWREEYGGTGYSSTFSRTVGFLASVVLWLWGFTPPQHHCVQSPPLAFKAKLQCVFLFVRSLLEEPPSSQIPKALCLLPLVC